MNGQTDALLDRANNAILTLTFISTTAKHCEEFNDEQLLGLSAVVERCAIDLDEIIDKLYNNQCASS